MKKFNIALSSLAVAVAGVMPFTFSSCNSEAEGWCVQGTIENAEKGSKMALEAFNNGRWYVVDSIEFMAGGDFRYTAEMPAAYPEVMRLTLPDEGSIYFPVDSVDKLLVSSAVGSFATKSKVTGTEAAVNVSSVDSLVNEATARLGVAAAQDTTLKRRLVRYITTDTTAVVAYYVINKSVGNVQIFNPADTFDNRVYGAAAQIFYNHRPNDMRGKILTSVFFEGRKALGKSVPQIAEQEIEVAETALIDIVRYDNKGVKHSLSEVAGKGNVTLLSFSAYDIETSPAYNIILNKVYERYHDKGLEIYQIAFDVDEIAWKQAAVNLPWITVWNSPNDGSSVLASYNVGALPMTFVIDRDGEIAARILNPDDIATEVAKYMR